MKKLFVVISFIVAGLYVHSQNVWNTEDIQAPADYENIHVQKLASDSLGTAFLIWVKDKVAMHHHAVHTESVYILEGEGEMSLSGETFKVKAGDFIFIPMGELHDLKVTSKYPVKAISFQAPEFLGKDRIFAGQLKSP